MATITEIPVPTQAQYAAALEALDRADEAVEEVSLPLSVISQYDPSDWRGFLARPANDLDVVAAYTFLQQLEMSISELRRLRGGIKDGLRILNWCREEAEREADDA